MDWETVYERNSVERIKRDKPPLGIREELPALVGQGYEAMAEEDVVRLQWWGLYHDKPKIGTFMLRVKIPSGILTPAKLRRIETSRRRPGLPARARVRHQLGRRRGQHGSVAGTR